MTEECVAQKKMVNNVFISGAGNLQKNEIKWIVHLKSPDDEADCETVTLEMILEFMLFVTNM